MTYEVKITSEVLVLYKVVKRQGEAKAVYYVDKADAEQAAKALDASLIEVRLVPAASLPVALDAGWERGRDAGLEEAIDIVNAARRPLP